MSSGETRGYKIVHNINSKKPYGSVVPCSGCWLSESHYRSASSRDSKTRRHYSPCEHMQGGVMVEIERYEQHGKQSIEEIAANIRGPRLW